MKNTLLVKSTNNNHYLCSLKKNKTHFVHPLINYLYQLHSKEIDIDLWFKKINQFPLSIENIGIFSSDELIYNINKFKLIQQAGYFESYNMSEKISRKISELDIKTAIANVSHIIIELTDACNLNCLYCGYGKYYQRDFDKRENKFLNTDIAKTFIQYLITAWNSPLNRKFNKTTTISLYGGEPLLNFTLIQEIVEYTKTFNLTQSNLQFSISTNGLLIDRHLDYIVENDIELAISLDGDAHANSFRVDHNNKESYLKLRSNIELIRKKYPDFYEKKVKFCSVLHSKNSIQHIDSFFKKELNKKPSIAELSKKGIHPDFKNEFEKIFNSYQNNLTEKPKKQLKRIYSSNGVSHFIEQQNDFCANNYKDLIFPEIKQVPVTPTRTCIPFAKKIFLNVNGKLLPCETIDHKYAQGQVTKDKVDIDFSAICNKYDKYFSKIKTQCNHCYFSETCEKCIFDFDIESQKKFFCIDFMNKSKFESYLSQKVDFLENNPESYSMLLGGKENE